MDIFDAGFFARRAKRVVGTERKEAKLSSTVRRCTGDKGDEDILTTFKTKAPNSEFKLFVKHGDHFHILHDCLFSNGCCRCWKFSTTRRRTPKPLCREFKEEDWRLLFEYHVFDGSERQVMHFQIGKTDYTSQLPNRHETIQPGEPGYSGNQSTRSMEACNAENKILWKFGRSNTQGDSESDREGDELYEELLGENQTKKRRKRGDCQEEDQEKIYSQLIKICAAPITDGDRKPQWVHPESSFKFKGEYMFNVKLAKQAIQLYFCNLTLKEFKEFYDRRIVSPIWGALSVDKFYDHYFPRDISLAKIIQLLVFQIVGVKSGGIVDNISYKVDKKNLDWQLPLFSFIRQLIIFLDKKSGKKNCMYFISPPSSGKTFFWDCIRDYLLCHGNMTNWNRYERFPLQMLVDKRVGFWNEPNCEPNAIEDLKKVLGGEYYCANIKNKNHAEIHRTPIVITGNNDIFKNNIAMEHRIDKFYWRNAPFLIDNKSYRLHPMAFEDLMNMCENYYEEILRE